MAKTVGHCRSLNGCRCRRVLPSLGVPHYLGGLGSLLLLFSFLFFKGISAKLNLAIPFKFLVCSRLATRLSTRMLPHKAN